MRVFLVTNRVSYDYFSVGFNSVRKIPYYIITGIQKTDCLVLADFVNVFMDFYIHLKAIMNIAKVVTDKRNEVFQIIEDIISSLLKDVGMMLEM